MRVLSTPLQSFAKFPKFSAENMQRNKLSSQIPPHPTVRNTSDKNTLQIIKEIDASLVHTFAIFCKIQFQ